MPPQRFPYSNNLSPQNYQAEEDSNTIAIIGLILAFIIPLAGFICSIIGLSKAKKLDGKNRGVAMAGLIISILLPIITILSFGALVYSVYLQQEEIDSQKREDILMIQNAIETYADKEGEIPTDKAALSEALTGVSLIYYQKNSDKSVDSFGETRSLGIDIEEKTESVPSDTDQLPGPEEVHILIGAQCKTVQAIGSGSFIPIYYTAGGANVVEEADSQTYAIIYNLQLEEALSCIDNAN